MANSPTSSPLHLIIFIFSYTIFQTFCHGATNSHKIPLIHRNSPLSPYHNAEVSISDYWSSFLKRSELQHDFIQSALTNSSTLPQTTFAPRPRRLGQLNNPFFFGEYLVKFSVGTPAVEFFGVVDFNGDFIHTKCDGCTDCGKRGVPMYKLNMSSTYKNVPCASVVCTNQDVYTCAGWDQCEYDRKGPYGVRTTGILASDTLRLPTATGGLAAFKETMVGCCADHCPVHNKVSAWMGIAGGIFSLIYQFSYDARWRFSYCLNSDAIGSSHLQFGDKAVLSGFPAKMYYCSTGKFTSYLSARISDFRVNQLYYLAGAVSFGCMDTCNVVFDTLSPMSYFSRVAFDHLVTYLPQDVKLPVVKHRDWDLCFTGTQGDMKDLPEIGIAFYGAGKINGPPGVLDIDFPVENTYGMVDGNTICLLFKPTDGKNIIGTRIMHNVMVGFDLLNSTIYMKRQSCGGLYY